MKSFAFEESSPRDEFEHALKIFFDEGWDYQAVEEVYYWLDLGFLTDADILAVSEEARKLAYTAPVPAQLVKAVRAAGYAEWYAMEHGEREAVIMNGHKCYRFSYDPDDGYQDGNGATYDCVEGKWLY